MGEENFIPLVGEYDAIFPASATTFFTTRLSLGKLGMSGTGSRKKPLIKVLGLEDVEQHDPTLYVVTWKSGLSIEEHFVLTDREQPITPEQVAARAIWNAINVRRRQLSPQDYDSSRVTSDAEQQQLRALWRQRWEQAQKYWDDNPFEKQLLDDLERHMGSVDLRRNVLQYTGRGFKAGDARRPKDIGVDQAADRDALPHTPRDASRRQYSVQHPLLFVKKILRDVNTHRSTRPARPAIPERQSTRPLSVLKPQKPARNILRRGDSIFDDE